VWGKALHRFPLEKYFSSTARETMSSSMSGRLARGV